MRCETCEADGVAMDPGVAVVAILTLISHHLAVQTVEHGRRPATEVCMACGCLCLADEKCPGCASAALDTARAVMV